MNVNNELIGVAFQSLSASDVENIGHVVPITVLNHFLDAIERNGKYDGVCSLGIRLQGMENADIRRHYGMFVKSIKGDHYGLKGAETGVLVVNIAPLSPAAEILKKGDVILSINGIKVFALYLLLSHFK